MKQMAHYGHSPMAGWQGALPFLAMSAIQNFGHFLCWIPRLANAHLVSAHLYTSLQIPQLLSWQNASWAE